MAARSGSSRSSGGKKLGAAGGVVAFFTALALSCTFLAVGLLACVAPPTTTVLARFFVDDATSPFTRDQLVTVAEATREYSFGNHDLGELYQAIYDVDRAYADTLSARGQKPESGFPALVALSKRGDVTQLRAAFSGASEVYAYSPATIMHLDDCYHLYQRGLIISAVLAVLALAGCVFMGVKGGMRKLGILFICVGAFVITLGVVFGVLAFMGFDGMFTMLHGLFFTAGTWVFPGDSLLICALPTAFWMGMGVVLVVVALLLSVVSILVGRALVRRARR